MTGYVSYFGRREQDISLFSNEDTPISAGIVIDDSGGMRGKIGQVLAATMAFARSSNPDDELFVAGSAMRWRMARSRRATPRRSKPPCEPSSPPGPDLPRSLGPLLGACERIAREIRSGYTLGYVPPDRDGAFHRVRVVIVGPDANGCGSGPAPEISLARSVE